ncbi:MAG: adenine phosphoribosyltransferase [Verrucomicrobiales bacterium]|nr:adenine phosphoribosyltransferase [Verrucomicrobiales bacterium]
MNASDLDRLSSAVRDVPDFPKDGILFKDITTLLADGELFRLSIAGLIETAGENKVDKVIGIDARGFIFGAAVADRIGAGFVPMRKKGKLPWQTIGMAYALEYGEAEIELHKDSLSAGENILLVDDLLATGGTAGAAIKLVRELGANLIAASFLIELEGLNGRDVIGEGVRIESLLKY